MRLHYLQHVSFETPGRILDWAASNDVQVSATKFFEDDYILPAQDDFDVLVVMGGPMGVYDVQDYPWLNVEKEFLKHTIESEKPVLGICLGAQLIARSLGAKVYQGTKEIGWFPIQKVNEGRFLKDFPNTINVMHWHGDTFDLPEGATLIASNEVTKNQAFEYKNCLALQFHFEMGPDNVGSILEHAGDDLTLDPYVQTAEQIQSETSFFAENKTVLFHLLDTLFQQ